MSEMVERVARAITAVADETVGGCSSDRCCCSGADALECKTGLVIDDLARAAIAAMREPTASMSNSGTDITWWTGSGDEEWEENVSSHVARQIFQAMIDAALK